MVAIHVTHLAEGKSEVQAIPTEDNGGCGSELDFHLKTDKFPP